MKVRCGQSAVHGLGVFAVEDFDVGDIIEVCQIILVPPDEVPYLDRTCLSSFYYGWPTGEAAIALGLGSIYNHSYAPNADYQKDVSGSVVRIVAATKILGDEEVLVDYSRGGTNPLWFVPKP